MTTKDLRILGYTSLGFGALFGYLNSQWISLVLCVISLVCLVWLICLDFFKNDGGDGPGPLRPA